jgi:hypothetical protein
MRPSLNERVLRTAAALGIDSAAGDRAHAARIGSLALAADRLRTELAPGRVALVGGPSGAGKTTLLRLLARDVGAVSVRPLTRRQRATRVAALRARTPLDRWVGLLARFGLAEARVLVSLAGGLSAGERARLELALAAAKCEQLGCRRARSSETGAGDAPKRSRVITLIVDEWCSVLDRPMAASVAMSAARWARQPQAGVRLIGATAHDDLAAVILADVTVRIDETGGVRWAGTACGLSKAG